MALKDIADIEEFERSLQKVMPEFGEYTTIGVLYGKVLDEVKMRGERGL